MAYFSIPIIAGRVATTFIGKNKIAPPVHPALLMVLFWTFIYFVYLFGPIYLTPNTTSPTFIFIGLHLLCFTLGATVFSRIFFFKSIVTQSEYISYIPERNLMQLACTVLAIGIIGGLLSIYSKLSFLEVINVDTITQLRGLRAQGLLAGEEGASSLFSAIGFLTYPAGFVGLVIAIISYENMPPLPRFFAAAYVLVIVMLAVCAGGRSPILVLFLFIGSSCYVRGKLGKSFIPKSFFLRMAFICLMVLFVIYSSFIWIARAKDAKMTNNVMLEHAATVWGAHPKAYLLEASQSLGKPGLTQTVLGTVFYFIQSLSISERLLSAPSQTPVLYGAYQVDLIAALLRAFPGGGEFLKDSYAVLLDENIYGFFTGAWSGLFIDLGGFSFLAALIWGYFAGKSWLNFKRNPNALTSIAYIFWMYSVFISFVSAPFGFSNSFMICFWFAAFALVSLVFLRYQRIVLKPAQA